MPSRAALHAALGMLALLVPFPTIYSNNILPPPQFASADDSINCILDKYEGPIVGKRTKSANVISVTSDVADEESCAQLCNSVADEECLGFSYRADREKCYLVNTAGTDGKTICIYF